MNGLGHDDRAPRELDEDDPQGAAIHAATQAIYDLYDTVSVETAHWIATVAIINADRAARSKS